MAFSISSYNLHGLRYGQDFLKTYINDYLVTCVQEHWLFESELQRIFSNRTCIALSSMSTDMIGKPSHPFGGLAIFVPNEVNVTLLGVSQNNHILAIKMTLGADDFVLCNMYLPCLSSSLDYIDEITSICGFLDNIFQEYVVENTRYCCG